MKFWQELRRRRVYRLAGLYIVGAWLVIQVVEMLFQAWGSIALFVHRGCCMLSSRADLQLVLRYYDPRHYSN